MHTSSIHWHHLHEIVQEWPGLESLEVAVPGAHHSANALERSHLVGENLATPFGQGLVVQLLNEQAVVDPNNLGVWRVK